MNKKVITPEDLADFGNIPPGFVPSSGPKIVVPPPVTKDSPLEDIETPDELEAGTVHGKDWTEEDSPSIVSDLIPVPESEQTQEQEIKIREPGTLDYVATYPDYQLNVQFQIKMFHDMLHQTQVERRAVQLRMQNLEIQLDMDPDSAGTPEINEMRKLMIRDVELQNEIGHYSQHIQVRTNAIAGQQKQAFEAQKLKKWWKFNK